MVIVPDISFSASASISMVVITAGMIPFPVSSVIRMILLIRRAPRMMRYIARMIGTTIMSAIFFFSRVRISITSFSAG